MPNSANDLDINLFISTQCPHCSQAIELLTKAVKQGTISRLNITNLNSSTIERQYSHIRSVPYIQVQDFEFTGTITNDEINNWAQAHKDNSFANYYYSMLLMDGKLSKVESFIKNKPEDCIKLIYIAKDIDTKMQVRIGVTAVFETIAADIVKMPNIENIIQALITTTDTAQTAIRVDLIYLASLLYAEFKQQHAYNITLFNFINSLSNDKSDEVKEIISDVLV